MQGGTGAAPPTWATLHSWLHRRKKHGVLLIFENSENMLQDEDTICEVLHMFLSVMLAVCSYTVVTSWHLQEAGAVSADDLEFIGLKRICWPLHAKLHTQMQ